ncbi:MAG: hypothetical protein ACLU8W_13225 [Clostridia bacterium]
MDASMPAPDSAWNGCTWCRRRTGCQSTSIFLEHPEMMLGQMAFDRVCTATPRETTCKPLEGESLSDLLAKAVGNLTPNTPL